MSEFPHIHLEIVPSKSFYQAQINVGPISVLWVGNGGSYESRLVVMQQAVVKGGAFVSEQDNISSLKED